MVADFGFKWHTLVANSWARHTHARYKQHPCTRQLGNQCCGPINSTLRGAPGLHKPTCNIHIFEGLAGQKIRARVFWPAGCRGWVVGRRATAERSEAVVGRTRSPPPFKELLSDLFAMPRWTPTFTTRHLQLLSRSDTPFPNRDDKIVHKRPLNTSRTSLLSFRRPLSLFDQPTTPLQ